jgi:hypothetical protein
MFEAEADMLSQESVPARAQGIGLVDGSFRHGMNLK